MLEALATRAVDGSSSYLDQARSPVNGCSALIQFGSVSRAKAMSYSDVWPQASRCVTGSNVMKLMGPDGVVFHPLTSLIAPSIHDHGLVFQPHTGSALWVVYTAVMPIQRTSPS